MIDSSFVKDYLFIIHYLIMDTDVSKLDDITDSQLYGTSDDMPTTTTITTNPMMYITSKCCGNILSSILVGIMYIGFIILPSIIEIIVVTQQTQEYRPLTLFVCSCFQILISIYGGVRLGMVLFTSEHISSILFTNDRCYRCNVLTCNWNFVDYKSMSYPGYSILLLIPWFATNFIIWIEVGPPLIPAFVGILVFIPIATYVVSLFIGYALLFALQREIDRMNQKDKNDYVIVIDKN